MILLTDRHRLPDPLAAMERLPRGSTVIVRDYDHPARQAYAAAIVRYAKKRQLRVLIGKDSGLAVRLRADGVHFPEHCLAQARGYRRRFPHSYITVAAHSAAAIQRANRSDCCDALLLSPVFATASHPEARPLGVLRFAQLARLSRLPVYALGGMVTDTLRRLRGSAVSGIAGIGCFSSL